MITKLKVIEAFPFKRESGMWDFVRPGKIIEITDRTYALSLVNRGKAVELNAD